MQTPSWFLKRNFIAYVLLPVSVVYFIASTIVFKCRLFYQKTSKRPVICIGNIMAGGVGKTPIVRAVAKHLKGSVVVMRGYGGGDEAKMLCTSGINVFTGADRKKSISAAEQAGAKYIIMDDGFQNPTVKKDLSIIVFDGKIGAGNGFMLPAGPLREPLCTGIKRADAIIIVNSEQRTMNSLKKYNKPIFSATTKHINPGIKGKVFAFAGIGYPQKFFDGIDGLFDVVGTVPYPDHYNYSTGDLDKIIDMADKSGADYIITTEKDWVRLPDKYQEIIDFIPMELTIEKGFWKWLGLQKL
ncbi:MAG: tetraacyldisaccharide 4'-kinase [Alphaproteobacteria bacterium]|nr:tetraacyldisaccharide 4'-kinase [Alphaproteobacteria bacterium]